MFYAEDHCSLRWPVLFNGIAWPALFLIFLIVPFATGNLLLLNLALVAGILCAVGGSIFGLVITWPTGIRIDAEGIRIGGVRHAARRGGAGAGKLPTAGSQRRQVFSCPWNGVQNLRVVTDRGELKKLRRSSRGRGDLRVGILWSFWMKAALVVNVDPAAAQIPRFRPPDTQRYWFKVSRPTRAVPSPVWLAPTRHPERLREALTQFNAQGPLPSGQEARGL